jgi:hypothetical protein
VAAKPRKLVVITSTDSLKAALRFIHHQSASLKPARSVQQCLGSVGCAHPKNWVAKFIFNTGRIHLLKTQWG